MTVTLAKSGLFQNKSKINSDGPDSWQRADRPAARGKCNRTKMPTYSSLSCASRPWARKLPIVPTRPEPAGYMVEHLSAQVQMQSFFGQNCLLGLQAHALSGQPLGNFCKSPWLMHGEGRQVAALKPILASHLLFFLSLKWLFGAPGWLSILG